jgi:hypothetical protein
MSEICRKSFCRKKVAVLVPETSKRVSGSNKLAILMPEISRKLFGSNKVSTVIREIF